MANIIKSKVVFNGKNFVYDHRSMIPEFKNFVLHSHNGYEILIFLSGDANYVIESKTYSANPYDVFITKSDELHQVKHLSDKFYDRIVIQLSENFLTENNCDDYSGILKLRSKESDNIISPNSSGKLALIDCITRLEKYINETKSSSELIVKCTIIELLHILNTIKGNGVKYNKNKNIDNILNYINNNISDDISLDAIADNMFMSKYHICRIFKEYTGLTINKYITNKRIKIVQNLYANGIPLSSASQNAGFANYSSFYKAYYNMTGKSPRNDIENYNKFKEFEIQE